MECLTEECHRKEKGNHSFCASYIFIINVKFVCRYGKIKNATCSKAAANKKPTGREMDQTKCQSAAGQCIYELVGMKESVDCVDNSEIFGLLRCTHSSEKKTEPLPHTKILYDEVLD